MYYEKIEGMTLFVCRDVYMLYKIDAIEKVEKLHACTNARTHERTHERTHARTRAHVHPH